MNIVFFGSFQHYSTLILESLQKNSDINVVAVVTTQPMPAGRKKQLKKTHTHTWAEEQNIPIFTPPRLDHSSLQDLTSKIQHPHHFVVAGYGKILPPEWLQHPTQASLNIHFSLLPSYRGANPAEWAILMGETTTGISLITMNPKIDQGDIIDQRQIDITPEDTRESLYQNLYQLAANHAPEMILNYHAGTSTPTPQQKSPTPYARLLKRPDGHLPWQTIQKAITGTPLNQKDFQSSQLFTNIIQHSSPNSDESLHRYCTHLIEKASRALHGFPGLWATVPTTKGEKRLKIHSTSIYQDKLLLEQVQLEGQSKAHFNQIKSSLVDEPSSPTQSE